MNFVFSLNSEVESLIDVRDSIEYLQHALWRNKRDVRRFLMDLTTDELKYRAECLSLHVQRRQREMKIVYADIIIESFIEKMSCFRFEL
jgi:hypothetical protein